MSPGSRYLCRSIWAALCGASALCSLHCSQGNESTTQSRVDAGTTLIADGLRLSPSALQLFPGQRVKLDVRVSPPRVDRVNLFLLGNPEQAYLSDLQIYTDSQGLGSFWLTATGPDATFQVLAKSRSNSARTQIRVAPLGQATLRVWPIYSGMRTLSGWTASVVPGSRCDAVTASAAAAMWSGDSAPGQPVKIDDLPIGTPLAVTLRSGQTIAGCEDISGLFANEQRTVRVVAEDLPTRYASQDLNLTLNVISNVALQQHFNTDIGRLLGDWDNAPSDIDFVLDAMRAQLKDEPARLSFDDQRDQDGWSEQLGVALRPELAAHGLLDAAQRSLQSAVARWLAGKNFAGRLSFPSDASATALFQLATVGEVAASKVGFPSTHLVQVTREPADHLQLSFSFYFVQSQLFTGLSNSPTLLQDFVDCDRLAATLSDAR
ncbi:MAG TPA: hypothetical protein VL137_00105, partial [Polyangiaceae bacterium]|nr:hypothetical protein [Polyangiaceae bacterium]